MGARGRHAGYVRAAGAAPSSLTAGRGGSGAFGAELRAEHDDTVCTTEQDIRRGFGGGGVRSERVGSVVCVFQPGA